MCIPIYLYVCWRFFILCVPHYKDRAVFNSLFSYFYVLLVFLFCYFLPSHFRLLLWSYLRPLSSFVPSLNKTETLWYNGNHIPKSFVFRCAKTLFSLQMQTIYGRLCVAAVDFVKSQLI